LIAELADKYDTIGVDAVAMVVNDVIRSGAKPLALADNIHAVASEPKLVKAWLKGPKVNETARYPKEIGIPSRIPFKNHVPL
jgi:phosphoribosylformylglycinamidine cyclo-ligase